MMTGERGSAPTHEDRVRGRLSLRTKQSLAVGGVVGVMAAILVTLGLSVFTEHTFQLMRQRGLILARMLALSGEDSLELGDDGRLQRALERLTGEEGLVHVELVDAEGRVLTEIGNGNRPPQFALFERAAGAPRAPIRRTDTVSGFLGEPLYIFSVPIVRHEGESLADEGRRRRGGGLGPRSARAATGPASSRRLMGEIRMAFSPASVEEARRDLLFKGIGVSLMAILGSVLLTQVIARRYVSEPAARLAGVARRLATGDLTGRVRSAAADEMGDVVDAFNAVGDGLETMVANIRASSSRLDDVTEEIKGIADIVVAGTRSQQGSLERISVEARTMATVITRVSESVRGLSSSSEGTSTAILGVIASIEEVEGHADGLTMSVNDTSATTEEMVSSIKEIDRNVEMLNQFVAETSQAMSQMDQAIQQIESNAADSKGISQLVAQNAEKGMKAVELTIEGMEGISRSVVDSSKVIESVGRRGQEIGLILNVIEEVTEQTNLLALNAAIIAAQAGEHGRGFAVVAEEIRQLAERTASSAKEIGALIASFQSETGQAVAVMQEGSRRVGEGSERSREAGRALKEILESARKSSTMVGEIAAATREQAQGSQAISASVDKVRDMVTQIKRATAEQTLGSEQIMSAVENMREMAGHVKRATVDQTKGSRLITQAIENVTSMVSSIHRASGEQQEISGQILDALSRFDSVTGA
ncbi:MAG: methyl-accepting chemotaxis protein, partial [Gemmatimonadota bacterium]